VKEIVAAAASTRTVDRAAGTAKGVGTLRGAMSGVHYPAGSGGQPPAVLSSKCVRLDQARFAGVEPKSTEDASVSFAGGFGHENYLAELFAKGGYTNVPATSEANPIDLLYTRLDLWQAQPIVLKEQGIKAMVHGMPWQGTPDFLLREPVGSLHGVEAKSLQSNWTVAKVHRAGWPPRKHVLQCANYASILGFDEWLLAVGHYFYAAVDGEKFEPRVVWFRIFTEGLDEAAPFKVERDDGEVQTLDFCRRDVLAYQKLILDSETRGVLAPRPKWKELFPGMKSYEECNYCSGNMLSECNRYDVGKLTRAEWMDRLSKKEKS
jgi:hypothetical protein